MSLRNLLQCNTVYIYNIYIYISSTVYIYIIYIYIYIHIYIYIIYIHTLHNYLVHLGENAE